VENFYTRERNHFHIIEAFSFLALILSVMDCSEYHLSAYRKGKGNRYKESKRASVSEVLLMLNADFIKWVLLAIAVSVPFLSG